MILVLKRDGGVRPFNVLRIKNAILKAQEEVGQSDFKIADHIGTKAQMHFRGRKDVSIKEIQDLVEDSLMEIQPDVAKAYIAYRSSRDVARDKESKLFTDISGLLSNSNKQLTNENANKDSKVIPVQRDLIAGIVSKHIGLNFVLPEHIKEAHLSGDIHYHDLDYSPSLPMTNCCLVDLTTLLRDGFCLGNAKIESPKSVGVACAVMAQITAQVASHQYGGTTFANVDKVLSPYAELSYNKHLLTANKWNIPNARDYADALTQKEIYDGIQAYEYEINTLFTTNGQTPFVTITFGTGVDKFSKWIQEAILKVRIKGLGKDGITAVFPKLVMFLEEGINLKPEDPNYDIKQLALECSSKRLYPDIISSRINREVTGSPTPVSPMGCRSFLSGWMDGNGSYTLDGRNNLGVVSINLPRIAIESGGNFEKFWNSLRDRLELAKQSLDTRIDSLRGVKASVAPILYVEGAFGVKLKPDEEIINIFKNGRASISVGYIGLHEVMSIMFPDKPPFENKRAQKFALSVVQFMKDETVRWRKESPEGWGYSLYSTPSESLCDRFCKLDRQKFGEIEGITNKGWYTNSFHLDVMNKVDPIQKIDFEKTFHWIASGGHITYAEFPNMRNNLKGLEAVWDYAVDNLAYFGTNTPSDQCFECGFEGEFSCTSRGFSCPSCGNNEDKKMSVIRRVCGYLGSPNARGFNEGKQLEVESRVKHV